jgi:hypothetical protein
MEINIREKKFASRTTLAAANLLTQDLIQGEEKTLWVPLKPQGELQLTVVAVDFGQKPLDKSVETKNSEIEESEVDKQFDKLLVSLMF